MSNDLKVLVAYITWNFLIDVRGDNSPDALNYLQTYAVLHDLGHAHFPSFYTAAFSPMFLYNSNLVAVY